MKKPLSTVGRLHWVLPIMLGLVAVSTLLSDRDLSKNFTDLAQGGGPTLHPAVPWIQRGVSVVLVLISLERLWAHAHAPQRRPLPMLLWAFALYWLATVAAPALFSANPRVSHEYLYPLIIGCAALLRTPEDRDRVVDSVRTALLVFLLAGVALAAVKPALVLDMKYSQGLLPGVPRFGGLAPHPVALGILAQTFLLCLWVRPFQRRWLNLAAWAVGLGVLFFAQSKTAWIGFLLCATAMMAVRTLPRVWQRAGDPRQAEFGIAICVAIMLVTATLLGVLLFADLGAEAADFLSTPEGAQLMTMTGRDQIWAVAWEEWRSSPVFGYGPTLWDDDFRNAIGMPNATNAHNQFMDTLARTGTVGAVALVLYATVLLALSLRAARATGGLSIALFIALALRSVSEVPLLVLGYGSEFFTHLLLLITVAPHVLPQAAKAPHPARRSPYRTAT